MNKYLEQAEEYARDYDRGAAEQSYHGPEMLFGLMFEYLDKNVRLLNIAIGTGLDASLFKKAGIKVFGVDGSAEMIKICEEKKVAVELRQVDLLKDSIPYPDGYFNLAVANSLFHMIEDPAPVFRETSRVLKKTGVYGFTIDEMTSGKFPSYRKTRKPGVYSSKHPESGLQIYRHSDEFIKSLCQKSGFEILKKTVFLTFRGKDGLGDFYYSAYIVRKN